MKIKITDILNGTTTYYVYSESNAHFVAFLDKKRYRIEIVNDVRSTAS